MSWHDNRVVVQNYVTLLFMQLGRLGYAVQHK